MRHHNPGYSGGFPIAVGDRYYAQDMLRDLRFNQSQLGERFGDIYNLPDNNFIISGLVCSQGAGHTMSISAGKARIKYNIIKPDESAAWTIPPSTDTEDIFCMVNYAGVTDSSLAGATADGVTSNYVKLAYTETDGNTRTRAKKAGSYAYEVYPDITLTIDAVAPTNYEVSLATFTTDGATVTFTDDGHVRPKIVRTYDYVISSSDSTLESQSASDLIIDIGDDAGAAINEIIDKFNAEGGGTIFLHSGTYNVTNYIYIKDGVSLIGENRSNTVINRNANIGYVVIIFNITTGAALENVKIDGKKSIYFPSPDRIGIHSSNTYNNVIIKNVTCIDNYGQGFSNCKNIYNCISDNNYYSGFFRCHALNHCIATNNTNNGFEECEYAINCIADSNTSNGFDSGYFISNCYSINNVDGFNGPLHVVNSYAYQNSQHGFANVDRGSTLRSQSNGGSGFNGCDNLSGCYSFSNTVNGFTSCKRCSSSESQQCVIGFNACSELSACQSLSNTSHGFYQSDNISACLSGGNGGNGYNDCEQISSSQALTNTGDGFLSCVNISGCKSQGSTGGNGFNTCSSISACISSSNSGDGFKTTNFISSCQSNSNGGDGYDACVNVAACRAGSNTGWGFNTCTSVGHCRSLSNTAGQYTATYADFGGTQASADNSGGGWNG